MNSAKTCIYLLAIFSVTYTTINGCNNYESMELNETVWNSYIHKGQGIKGMDYLGLGKCATLDQCKTLCTNTDKCNFFGVAFAINVLEARKRRDIHKNQQSISGGSARLFHVNSHQTLLALEKQQGLLSTFIALPFNKRLYKALQIPSYRYVGYVCQNRCNYERSDKVLSGTTKGVHMPEKGITLLSSSSCKTVDECKERCKLTSECNYFTRDSKSGNAYLYGIAFSYAPLQWENGFRFLGWLRWENFDSYFCNSSILPAHFSKKLVKDIVFWAAMADLDFYHCYNVPKRQERGSITNVAIPIVDAFCRMPSTRAQFCMNTAKSFIGTTSASSRDTLDNFRHNCTVVHPKRWTPRNAANTPCDQFYDYNEYYILAAFEMCDLALRCRDQAVWPDIPIGFIQIPSQPHCCTNDMYWHVEATVADLSGHSGKAISGKANIL